jgi:hypothetical protein
MIVTRQAGVRDGSMADDQPYNRITKARQDPRRDEAWWEDSHGTTCSEGVLKAKCRQVLGEIDGLYHYTMGAATNSAY